MKLTPVTAQHLDGIARVYLCSLQTTYLGLLPQAWLDGRTLEGDEEVGPIPAEPLSSHAGRGGGWPGFGVHRGEA